MPYKKGTCLIDLLHKPSFNLLLRRRTEEEVRKKATYARGLMSFIPNQLRFPKNRKRQRTALTESTSSLLRKPETLSI